MSLSHALLDLFFPPRCPICGRFTKSPPHTPCAKCQAAEFWIPEDRSVCYGAAFERCVCLGWYQGQLKESIRRFKFLHHPEYAKTYGPLLAQAVMKHLAGKFDCVTWMPVSPTTLKSRGYDQARLLAEATAESLHMPAVPLLVKTGYNVPQSSLTDGRMRSSNVSGVYTVPLPSEAAGQRVLLIDDILTTGSTLNEGARTLRASGVRSVSAAVVCRTPPRQSSPKASQ